MVRTLKRRQFGTLEIFLNEWKNGDLTIVKRKLEKQNCQKLLLSLSIITYDQQSYDLTFLLNSKCHHFMFY